MSEAVKVNEMMKKNNQDTVFFAQKIEFEKKQLVLGVGERVPVKLKVYPKEAENRHINYRYSDGDVIALNEDGVVTALEKGNAQIIAGCDYGTDLCEIKVEKGKQRTDLPGMLVAALEEKQMLLDYAVIQGDGILSYTSENAQVAEVMANKVLKLKQVGDTYIHCMCLETPDYKGMQKDVKLLVRYGIDLQLDNIETRNIEKGIRIKWNKVENVDGYFIYKQRAKGRKELIANVAADKELVFLDQCVCPGEQYTYFVQPYNGKYIGRLPEHGVTQTFLGKVELQRIACGDQAIHLEWEKIEGAEGYYIYRKSDMEGWTVIDALLQNDALSYDDAEVISGQEYTYIVSAYKGQFQGALNLQGYSIRYLDIPKVEMISNEIGAVKIHWNSIEGAQGYYIYKRNRRGRWKKIGQVNSKRTAYIDRVVASGSEYMYTVRAYYNKQLSDYVREGYQIIYLDHPQLQKIEKQNEYMTIYWSEVKGATGYHVYRKNTNGKWQRIGFVPGENDLSYTDSMIDSNEAEQFAYTVRACCKKSISTYDRTGIYYKNEG